MKAVNNKLKIAVLAGGIGSEREISIQSGSQVTSALKQAGVNAVLADITPEDTSILEDDSIDVFFVAMHGEFGEDGRLQQILEEKNVIYTGSRPDSCRLAFDKMASKKVFKEKGIKTPAAIEFDQNTDAKQLENELKKFGNKFVIKPIKEGSSVGVSITDSIGDAIKSAQNCLAEFGDCMIEQFIRGREVTVGVVCDIVLPIIEIRPERDFFNFDAKYIDDKTGFLFDTITDMQLAANIQKAAVDCFNVLGCRHFARVDFIVDDRDEFYALELNTIPGMTSHSLVPKAAEKIGLSLADVCLKIIESAINETEILNLKTKA